MAGRSGPCHHGLQAPVPTLGGEPPRRPRSPSGRPARRRSSAAATTACCWALAAGWANGPASTRSLSGSPSPCWPSPAAPGWSSTCWPGRSRSSRSTSWPGPGPARGRRPRQAFALGLVVLGPMLLLREIGLWFGDQIVWPIALAAAGSAVIWARSDDRDRARWARIPGNPIGAMFTRRGGLVRGVGGGPRVASGLGLGFANTGADLAAAGDALLGVAITVIGLSLIFGPWATRLASQLAEERRGRIRSEARAEMAAHLHDSVLHTLALIQRADASPEVVGLARRQERELRAWLYRAPVPADGRLRPAVEEIATRVEQRHNVPVDVVGGGGPPLGGGRRALG